MCFTGPRDTPAALRRPRSLSGLPVGRSSPSGEPRAQPHSLPTACLKLVVSASGPESLAKAWIARAEAPAITTRSAVALLQVCAADLRRAGRAGPDPGQPTTVPPDSEGTPGPDRGLRTVFRVAGAARRRSVTLPGFADTSLLRPPPPGRNLAETAAARRRPGPSASGPARRRRQQDSRRVRFRAPGVAAGAACPARTRPGVLGRAAAPHELLGRAVRRRGLGPGGTTAGARGRGAAGSGSVSGRQGRRV